MSNQYLPPELLDTITDFLHDSRHALENCCLVSKSWVPRTRKYLFANIEFRTAGDVESWKSTFPDPFTSPARYTKTLSIKSPWAAGVASVEEGRWIRSFSQVVHLKMNFRGVAADESTYSLFPFHGFSPAIKSLRLVYTASPLPLILSLVYSFPHLEDLCVIHPTDRSDRINNGFDRQPPTVQYLNPPAFTGSLELHAVNGIAAQLLSLSSGLHFRKLYLRWDEEGDVLSTTLLVESCCSTLESLSIDSGTYVNSSSESVNLSKATKLKDVVFKCNLRPRWVAATIQTITPDHRDLQKISIMPQWILHSLNLDLNHVSLADFRRSIGESACQGWSKVDHILARLLELRPIRLRVVYSLPPFVNKDEAKNLMESLFPEVTARGMVEMVGQG